MKDKIKKLNNLLEKFETSRDIELLQNVLEEVNSPTIQEAEISVVHKKMLTFAQIHLDMVVKGNKHPKIITNSMKKLIGVLENINYEHQKVLSSKKIAS